MSPGDMVGAELGIDRSEALQLLCDLVRIPSTTGRELPAAEYLRSYLEGCGIGCQFVGDADRPNIGAELRGSAPGPTLLLTGHLDVVPPGEGWRSPPFEPVVEGDLVFGRGACDMKGGLVSILLAARGIARAGGPNRGTLALAFVVDEEIMGDRGTRLLVNSGLRADMAVVAEPTGLRIVWAHKGLLWLQVEAVGVTAHGSRPEEGVNAIEFMAQFLVALKKAFCATGHAVHRELGGPTLNIGTICGGLRTNMVADRCVVTLDRRLPPGESLAVALEQIKRVLVETAEPWGSLQHEVTILAKREPFEVAITSPVVARLSRAVAEATGCQALFDVKVATTDASILQHEAGIPTVVFGPGEPSGNAHCPNESIDISQVVTAAKIFYCLARQVHMS